MLQNPKYHKDNKLQFLLLNAYKCLPNSSYTRFFCLRFVLLVKCYIQKRILLYNIIELKTTTNLKEKYYAF